MLDGGKPISLQLPRSFDCDLQDPRHADGKRDNYTLVVVERSLAGWHSAEEQLVEVLEGHVESDTQTGSSDSTYIEDQGMESRFPTVAYELGTQMLPL
jgi:hypothetical protein